MENVKNYKDRAGFVNSVYPCYKYLTFGPWIYLVPQYEPKSVLILGYGEGTTAGLIQLFYGDVPITAVDINKSKNFYGVEFIQEDAEEFVKTCGKYDVVSVDLFNNSYEPCDFVKSKEFAENLKRIANYIIIHTTTETDLTAYNDIKKIKTLFLNKSAFNYYLVNNVHRLLVK